MSLSTSTIQGRFLPGAMVAQRYRVVALLGRGGMGEVYRADDLKLGEAVALKFLPERVERDASLRERLLGEARLARSVAHPNVCRVYDIGEVDGRLFLSMEYVDGEDLATLLRRIGRLPQDKAVQLAREMCMGLQAAHEQGIVHRDLKPSNVMIDGRGRARLTDFGLAALAEGVSAEDSAAGTPAYMAPEQLLGVEATTRSDLYSLGLVLYELFTGKPAFAAAGWAEQVYLKQNTTPSSPSQVAPGLDPAIERAILRCLQPDPAQRPASATSIALALPGGDPLAAALAAGELPSPEMVAEAGSDHSVPIAQAVGWLAAFVVALVLLFVAAPRMFLIQQIPVGKAPPVLLDRARETAQALGYTAAPRDESAILLYDASQVTGLAKAFGARTMLTHLARDPGGAIRYMYRSSPRDLIPLAISQGQPGSSDPPMTVSGMVSLSLDGQGRLFFLEACPPERDSSAAGAAADWGKAFALAGLSLADFRETAPLWTPREYADQRMAWLGRVPGDSAIALRIEAAAYHGRLIGFRRIYPWTPAFRQQNEVASTSFRVLIALVWILFLGGLLFAAYVARQNLRAGRADTLSTLRMGLIAGLLMIGHSMLERHWVSAPDFIARRFFYDVAYAGLLFLVVAALYLTLEPVVRRTWPETLVSWVRLLDGKVRDARVGRDTMAALVLGIGSTLVLMGAQALWTRFTGQPPSYGIIDTPDVQTDSLMGPHMVLAAALNSLLNALQGALTGTALLAGATALVKKRIPALVFAGGLMMFFEFPYGRFEFMPVFALLLLIGMSGFTLIRFGFLSLVLFIAVQNLLTDIPLVLPGSSWYWTATATGVGLIALLAVWAFRGMLAGRALVSDAGAPTSSAPTSSARA